MTRSNNSRDRVWISCSQLKSLQLACRSPHFARQRLRRVMGYLRFSGDMGMNLGEPEYGKGKRKQDVKTSGFLKHLLMRTDQAAKATPNQPVVQSTMPLHVFKRSSGSSPAESELHAMVSGCSDGIFIKRWAEFLLSALSTFSGQITVPVSP